MPWTGRFADLKQYIESRCHRDHASGCLLWQGQLDKDGYGRFRTHAKDVWHKPHRLAYALVHGEIPEDLGVLHRCNVRNCCEPTHLYAGTQKQNVRDMLKPFEAKVAAILPSIIPRKHGLSIKAFSERTGISQNALRNRMGGHHSLDCPTI